MLAGGFSKVQWLELHTVHEDWPEGVEGVEGLLFEPLTSVAFFTMMYEETGYNGDKKKISRYPHSFPNKYYIVPIHVLEAYCNLSYRYDSSNHLHKLLQAFLPLSLRVRKKH